MNSGWALRDRKGRREAAVPTAVAAEWVNEACRTGCSTGTTTTTTTSKSNSRCVCSPSTGRSRYIGTFDHVGCGGRILEMSVSHSVSDAKTGAVLKILPNQRWMRQGFVGPHLV